jgi:hypothetical protein
VIRRPVIYGCAFLLAAAIEVTAARFLSDLGSPSAIILIASACVLTFVGMGILVVARYSLEPGHEIRSATDVPRLAPPLLDASDLNEAVTEVSLEFTPSKENFAEAKRAASRYLSYKARPAGRQRPSSGNRRLNGIFGWVVFIGLAVMLVLLVKNSRPAHRQAPSAASVPTPQSHSARYLAFVLGASGIVLIAWGLKLLKDSMKPSFARVRVRLSSNTVVISCNGVEVLLLWRCFESMSDTPNLVVLHQRKGVYRFLPKAAFRSPEQLKDLYRIVAINLPQPTEPALLHGATS